MADENIVRIYRIAEAAGISAPLVFKDEAGYFVVDDRPSNMAKVYRVETNALEIYLVSAQVCAVGAPPKPSVGRLVHYTNLGDREGKYPPDVHAALITKVNADESVALRVFYPSGIFDMASVEMTTEPAGSEGARGKWAWPARQEKEVEDGEAQAAEDEAR